MLCDTIHQALICHAGKTPLIYAPATSRLRCYVPVYIYLITGYNTPEKLGDVVSCVPAAFAPPLHLLTLDATGASLYVPHCFRCLSLLTVHVETEVVPNVSYPQGHAHLESS